MPSRAIDHAFTAHSNLGAASDPTYVIRAFYDTGRKAEVAGRQVPVLQPMVPFGYFADHPGDLAGWRHHLEGAEQVAENWYKVAVPHNGKVKIVSEIEAVEPKRYGIGLHLGTAMPQGSFGSSYDSHLSFGANLEYRLNNEYSVIAGLARDAFDARAGAPSLRATRLTAGARRYLMDGATRPFVAAEAGSYSFDPGSTHAGASVGIGVQYNFDARFGAEAVYQLHTVGGNGPNSRYGVFQVGARLRF